MTVIAAGFDGGSPRPARQPTRRVVETPRPSDPIEDAINVTTAPPSSSRSEPRQPDRVTLPSGPAETPVLPRREPPAPRRTIVFEDEIEEELDVPDFLK